jgi:hypothetical protein
MAPRARRKSITEITTSWTKSIFAVALFFTAGPSLILTNKVMHCGEGRERGGGDKLRGGGIKIEGRGRGREGGSERIELFLSLLPSPVEIERPPCLSSIGRDSYPLNCFPPTVHHGGPQLAMSTWNHSVRLHLDVLAHVPLR